MAWSVANASAAKVSIMRLIQRSCTALRADSSDAAARAVTIVMTTWFPLGSWSVLGRWERQREKLAPSVLVLTACDRVTLNVEPVAEGILTHSLLTIAR